MFMEHSQRVRQANSKAAKAAAYRKELQDQIAARDALRGGERRLPHASGGSPVEVTPNPPYGGYTPLAVAAPPAPPPYMAAPAAAGPPGAILSPQRGVAPPAYHGVNPSYGGMPAAPALLPHHHTPAFPGYGGPAAPSAAMPPLAAAAAHGGHRYSHEALAPPYRPSPVHAPAPSAAYEKADDARSDYVRMLDEQVRLKKERKEEEKRKQREREAREEREMREYNPWGKGGAGAPLRDASGAIVTDLRQHKRQNSHGSPGRASPTRPPHASPPRGQAVPETLAPAYHGASAAHAPAAHAPAAPVADGGVGDDGNHARFRFDQMSPEQQRESQMKARAKADYQAELRAQIQERKAAKEQQKKLREAQDRRDAERIELQRAELAREASGTSPKSPARGAAANPMTTPAVVDSPPARRAHVTAAPPPQSPGQRLTRARSPVVTPRGAGRGPVGAANSAGTGVVVSQTFKDALDQIGGPTPAHTARRSHAATVRRRRSSDGSERAPTARSGATVGGTSVPEGSPPGPGAGRRGKSGQLSKMQRELLRQQDVLRDQLRQQETMMKALASEVASARYERDALVALRAAVSGVPTAAVAQSDRDSPAMRSGSLRDIHAPVGRVHGDSSSFSAGVLHTHGTPASLPHGSPVFIAPDGAAFDGTASAAWVDDVDGPSDVVAARGGSSVMGQSLRGRSEFVSLTSEARAARTPGTKLPAPSRIDIAPAGEVQQPYRDSLDVVSEHADSPSGSKAGGTATATAIASTTVAAPVPPDTKTVTAKAGRVADTRAKSPLVAPLPVEPKPVREPAPIDSARRADASEALLAEFAKGGLSAVASVPTGVGTQAADQTPRRALFGDTAQSDQLDNLLRKFVDKKTQW